ncbi:MAG: N-acetylmuramoyl-L-alanine amidase [Flavobacteriaceae bacterium]|nr:N-acetylmuramoyl-L-alanine amidase [Flavobacteriaceae bacterium]
MKHQITKIKNFFFIIFISGIISVSAQEKLKIVLDAGHGGKDFGAIHHGFVEKNIALDVTLRVGKILEKHKDIDLIYTRKTDVFVDLKDRAHIANKADANLFVSIHCNGVDNQTPSGTETFVMGLTRNAMNLEVAKKENSVIFLETDYKLKYAGFDPNDPISSIGLRLLQENNLDQSSMLANEIQKKFTDNLKRKDRGVKQAPIWVLDATVMPGVLVEVGFLSNKTEGTYVNSEKGRAELAQAIADGILMYKKEYYGSSIADNTPQKNISETQNTVNNNQVTNPGVLFKIQISASGRKLETTPQNFNGLSSVSVIQEGSLYKYFYQETSSYEDAKSYLQEAKNKGFDTAFIIPFKDGKRISIQDALKAQ